VWQSSRIRSVYRPRATLSQVFRQYLQYGYWKPFVMKKHGQAASPRHLVPGVFVLLLGVFALLLPVFEWPLVALVSAYVLGVLAMTAAVARSSRLAWPVLWRVPDVIVAYHFGYGIGSLIGWWDVLRGGMGRERFGRLTR
jgi:succinoglycan biosynthesis protein ExoA